MGTAPAQQHFGVVWPVNFPASVLSNNDVVNALNSISSSDWNSVLTDVITVSQFLAKGFAVQSVSVQGAHWVASSGNCAMAFDLYTVVDPLTTTDVVGVLVALSGLVVSAYLVFIGRIGGTWGAIIALAFAIVGSLLILNPIVSEIVQVLTWVLIGLGAVAAIGVGAFLYDFLKDRELRKEVYRSTGSAAERAAGGVGRVATRGVGAAARALAKKRETKGGSGG